MARAKRPSVSAPTAAMATSDAMPAPLAPWARIATGVLLAAGVVLCVTFRIYDSDIWQHLLVGKAIWSLRAIPHVQLWTWPTYGAPDVLPSWLFRALLWPFWVVAGVPGLFAWRWLTGLTTFGLLWWAAWRAGARGAFTIVALFWSLLFYRYRSQARPETLVAILLAAQLFILETRRARGVQKGSRDPAWWLVPIALLWANVHLSYYMGLAITGFYLLDDWASRRRRPAGAKAGSLALVLLACIAASFVNPFGWRALAQPFEYFLFWRHEPIFKIIGELQPVNWVVFSRSLLPLWLPAIAVLAIRHWRRAGIDWVQLLVIAAFLPLALSTQRFLGLFAVVIAPYFARDFDSWASSLRRPLVLRSAGGQVGAAALLMTLLWLPTLGEPILRPGWGVGWDTMPVRSCDWMRDHDVRGKGYNPFQLGGYLLWRFWPDRGRLPFMDIHQAGTPIDRTLAAYALGDRGAWKRLDDERRFDWALVSAKHYPNEKILEYLDTDTTTWALVHWDDGGALYLRRGGSMAALAESARFRLMPAGQERLGGLSQQIEADSTIRNELLGELDRSIGSSPLSGGARNIRATLELMNGKFQAARHDLDIAATLRDDIQRLHERLGSMDLFENHPREALAEFEREKHAWPESPTVDLRMGQALRRLGRTAEARAAFQRARTHAQVQAEADDSLAAMGTR